MSSRQSACPNWTLHRKRIITSVAELVVQPLKRISIFDSKEDIQELGEHILGIKKEPNSSSSGYFRIFNHKKEKPRIELI